MKVVQAYASTFVHDNKVVVVTTFNSKVRCKLAGGQAIGRYGMRARNHERTVVVFAGRNNPVNVITFRNWIGIKAINEIGLTVCAHSTNLHNVQALLDKVQCSDDRSGKLLNRFERASNNGEAGAPIF